MTLPVDSKGRKDVPVASGVLDYFPDAVAALARVSKIGNDKHNPGQPLHWSRDKSTDHADCLIRHFLGRGTIDKDCGLPHEASMAWRAMAMLQLAMEKLAKCAPTNTTVGIGGVAWGDPYTGSDVTSSYAAPPTQSFIPPTAPPFVLATKVAASGPQWLSEGTKVTKLSGEKFTFWYLATPYSKYPGGYELAAELSSLKAAKLLEARVPTFAPIAHSHPISKHTRVSNTDHDFWINADAPFIKLASGLIVVTAEGWRDSKGMAEEIKRFTEAGKPVVYWSPLASIPYEVRATATPK